MITSNRTLDPTVRPYVLLSGAASVDGYIDDATDQRLMLSNQADLDRVDQLRAECDAIMVGAATIRADNPRIMVASAQRRATRKAQGLPENPIKVTVSATGDLDIGSRWFHTGGERLVYTTAKTAPALTTLLAGVAEVVPVGRDVTMHTVLADLAARGVNQLMVEGGEGVNTAMLAAGVVDEIRLAIAPLLVGGGPRWAAPTQFPWASTKRMDLVKAETLGDMVVLSYRPDNSGGQ